MGKWHEKVLIGVLVIAAGFGGYFWFSGAWDPGGGAGDSAVIESAFSDTSLPSSTIAESRPVFKAKSPAVKSAKKTVALAIPSARAPTSVPVYAVPTPAVLPAPVSPTSSPPPRPAPMATAHSLPQLPPPQYLLSISMTGMGTGSVSSSPAAILCGFECQHQFASGTLITLVAVPALGSLFKGWSGACAATSSLENPSQTCSFIVSSSVAITAFFDLSPVKNEDPLPDAEPPPVPPAPPPGASSSTGHLVIAQIQIAGAVRSNSFVKIFNPTAQAVDVSDWKLRKRSSTGKDYSLRTIPKGSLIASGAYLTWANSDGGFAQSIGADIASTETLAAKNSVGLADASGALIDAVAWGAGSGQYVEGSAYPTDPAAGQILARKSQDGSVVDTENNANDFVLQ